MTCHFEQNSDALKQHIRIPSDCSEIENVSMRHHPHQRPFQCERARSEDTLFNRVASMIPQKSKIKSRSVITYHFSLQNAGLQFTQLFLNALGACAAWSPTATQWMQIGWSFAFCIFGHGIKDRRKIKLLHDQFSRDSLPGCYGA